MTNKQEILIAKLYSDAFQPGRGKRSDAYKQGVKHGITNVIEKYHGKKLDEVNREHLESVVPYEVGTAEADAWFSGNDEGRSRGWKEVRICKEDGDPCSNDWCDECERK